MRTTGKRHRREMSWALLAYVIVMLGIYPLARHVEAPLWRGLIALAPVLPFAAVMRAMIRQVRDRDEFQRRIDLEALAISAAVVSFVSMTAGFLVMANVIRVNGTILLWVFPVLAGLFGALRCWIARSYAHE